MLRNTQHTKPFAPDEQTITFWDYKIDYSKPLGNGKFGCVYEAVPRPEAEKGFLAYWFPYAYDTIFPVQHNTETQPSSICVKIYYSAWNHYLKQDNTFCTKRFFWNRSFDEPTIENKTNQILHKYHLTNIFFYANSYYSQFKTLIRGKTLLKFIEENLFFQPENYKPRKSFYDFMISLNNNAINPRDLHFENIMYDQERDWWEIIDGSIKEEKGDSLNEFMSRLQDYWWRGDLINFFFEMIMLRAKNNEPYFTPYSVMSPPVSDCDFPSEATCNYQDALLFLLQEKIIHLSLKKPGHALKFGYVLHWLEVNSLSSDNNINDLFEHLEKVNYANLVNPTSWDEMFNPQILLKKELLRIQEASRLESTLHLRKFSQFSKGKANDSSSAPAQLRHCEPHAFCGVKQSRGGLQPK